MRVRTDGQRIAQRLSAEFPVCSQERGSCPGKTQYANSNADNIWR